MRAPRARLASSQARKQNKYVRVPSAHRVGVESVDGGLLALDGRVVDPRRGRRVADDLALAVNLKKDKYLGSRHPRIRPQIHS